VEKELGLPIARGATKYRGDQLTQIALPMGGIGAGCVCLNGYGGFQDWSIKNKPVVTATPDGHGSTEGGFALLHVKGKAGGTRLLEGPMPVAKIYNQGLYSQGFRKIGSEGLPRFQECTFRNAYPFGQVELSHPGLGLSARITGWNPFIPLDDKNSSLPCFIMEYTFENVTAEDIDFEFSFHLKHLAIGKDGGLKGTRNAAMPGFGVHFSNTESPHAESFGSAALASLGGPATGAPRIKAMWPRSGWFDYMTALWREATTATFTENAGTTREGIDGNNGGSILFEGHLSPGQSVTYPIVIAWYFPNSNETCGGPKKVETAAAPCCAGDCKCGTPEVPAPKWRTYYAGQWTDAADVARYVRDNYADLRRRTMAFRQALATSTLPPEALDAVASNLAILKSPTVLRQENGNVWGWEGCFTNNGCCSGTCTHVWNYAQAMPHLFPKLERTLREQEYLRSMDDTGHVNFRAALPDGPTAHDWHPASDGQLGGVMKLYRDWQISGDLNWMQGMYPSAKKSLDYCINRWDPARQGALFEPHHNTYDIEFWGPDGMCSSVYLGALAALALMGRALGKNQEAEAYEALAKKGAAYLDSQLFNGEYFTHKVMYKELRDQTFANSIAPGVEATDPNLEMLALLRAEGPKYQYGSGCLADGVIGAWMANLYGIDTPQTREHVRKNLAAIFKYNFKADLFDHATTQRPGYALGHEPGLILCTWPNGGQPTLPFVYSDEVWTGIEYQVATHMIAEGLVTEGLQVVKGARSRYEGKTRNPLNEYECGNYYARAMASYALLQAISGFRYSAVSQTLWFGPKISQRPFKVFFSAATGWGTITLSDNELTVKVQEGSLAVQEVRLALGDSESVSPWRVTITAGKKKSLSLAQ